VGVLHTVAYLGIAYLVITVATGYFMQSPPAGWKPNGWEPSTTQTAQRAARDYTLGGALKTWQWWALWTLLLLNTSAGISIISQESPMFQEIAKASVIVAAGMVGIASIGNAVGRIFWAWISDVITRRWTFVVMFLIQVGLFWILPSLSSVAILTVVSFIILMCYGGGFGTMPAFAADYFGSTNVGPIYGLMLTAWGTASVFGPLLIAYMRESSGSYASGVHVIACIMAVSAVLPALVARPKSEEPLSQHDLVEEKTSRGLRTDH
jgi:OFA family oxalate/formate antiporter-like MFS transporter